MGEHRGGQEDYPVSPRVTPFISVSMEMDLMLEIKGARKLKLRGCARIRGTKIKGAKIKGRESGINFSS